MDEKKIFKLEKIQKGYAEVVVKLNGNFDNDDDPEDGFGYVTTEEFVKETNFETGKVTYVTRWVAYEYWGKPLYALAGNTLGYASRKEAVDALVESILYWVNDQEKENEK